MSSFFASFGEALYTGKGIRPKNGDSLVRPEWLGGSLPNTHTEVPRPYDASVPATDRPVVRSARPGGAPGGVGQSKDERDWDIVTPPSSPTHLRDMCRIADISMKKEKEKFPILPPAALGQQVIPYRALGEQACTARLRQFEEMEHQRLGVQLTDSDYLAELQDSCDWNVVERIVYDQRVWEREELKRVKDTAKAKPPDGPSSKVLRSNELVLLELIEDFDMDVDQRGEIVSCELECHITAETHLMNTRKMSLWLEKLFLLEECKLHPRIDQKAFRTEQVIRFMPDTEHVIELCNFKVLRSVLTSIKPPITIKPHFMFEGGICKLRITASVTEGYAENVDVIFPMPESIVAAPSLVTSGDAATAVFGNTTRLCRWQIPRLNKTCILEGMVALHPEAPVPTAGPVIKLKFEVVGLNVSGVSVAAVEADSDVQPKLVLKHVVRSVDSTVESTLGRIRQDDMAMSFPVFAL